MVGEQAVSISTTPGSRVLFLDLKEVASSSGVEHRVCPADKSPLNPVLELGDLHAWDSLQARPWESRTVLFDPSERLFKMWYAGADVTAQRRWRTGYAFSGDGLSWHKPELGLFAHNGNRATNIVSDAWGPVLIDPQEPDAARRYKMICKGPPRERGIRVAWSGDGLRWQEADRIDLPAWEGRTPDIVAFLEDPQAGDAERRFQLYWQSLVPSDKPGPTTVRAKNLAFSPDGIRWSASQFNPVLTPVGSRAHEVHFLMVIPYQGYYLMLYEHGWYEPDGTGVHGAYAADIRLAVSRDGEHYQRVLADQPLLPRGIRGAWDDRFLVISDKAVVKDDLIYLYYCGQGRDWTSWPASNCPAGAKPVDSSGCIRPSYTGLATMPVDRFTCLQNADRASTGEVVSVPLPADHLAGRRLVVNVSGAQPGRGWLEVEAVHPDTLAPWAGYSRKESRRVCTDGVCQPVTWESRGDLRHIPGPVALRFHLIGAVRLHAFGFEQA